MYGDDCHRSCVSPSLTPCMHGTGQVGRVLPPGGNRAHWLTWNRAHFGAWCIVSAPLILGLELNDSSLEPILDIIGNNEAIAVDQAFVGHPGRLVSELPVPPSWWAEDGDGDSVCTCVD